jgi:hypothetical protein
MPFADPRHQHCRNEGSSFGYGQTVAAGIDEIICFNPDQFASTGR